MSDEIETVITELCLHMPDATPGVCSRAIELIRKLRAARDAVIEIACREYAEADGERKELRAEIQRLKEEIVRVHRLPCQKCMLLSDELRRAEAERDAAIECIRDAERCWTFDDYQHHTHSWHTMQDWRERCDARLQEAKT